MDIILIIGSFLIVNLIVGFFMGVGKLNRRNDDWEKDMLEEIKNDYEKYNTYK